jgi:hypothetical protein
MMLMMWSVGFFGDVVERGRNEWVGLFATGRRKLIMKVWASCLCFVRYLMLPKNMQIHEAKLEKRIEKWLSRTIFPSNHSFLPTGKPRSRVSMPASHTKERKQKISSVMEFYNEFERFIAATGNCQPSF